jgi:zinc protease
MTDQCLPANPRLRSGWLDNGLAYYVLHNAKPANRAELRLVVRVGSINEREEERGLAHFVEQYVASRMFCRIKRRKKEGI